VELELRYSNREADVARLRQVRMAAETPRPAEGPRKPRQRHRRLSMSEMSKLIKEYEQGALVKELAERFGVHRVTVTALLEWHEVELRRSGLVREVIPIVARMYS
jgi:DNA-binding MarR family transcriptional regulator